MPPVIPTRSLFWNYSLIIGLYPQTRQRVAREHMDTTFDKPNLVFSHQSYLVFSF